MAWNSFEREALIRDFYTESADDYVGMWQIAGNVDVMMGSTAAVTDEGLSVARALMEMGLVVGDTPYAPGGFKAWDDQDIDTAIARLRALWVAKGETPDFLDPWFARPERATRAAASPGPSA